jgi:alpha-1,2-mannosyltransferase
VTALLETPTPQRPARNASRLPAIALGISLVVFVAVCFIVFDPGFFDIQTYRAEGATLRAGDDIYGPLIGRPGLATYPPFAVLLFVGFTLGSVDAVEVISVVGNIALLGWVCWLSLRFIGVRDVRTALAVCAVALWCEPVYTTIRYGQINLLIVALVLWDFTRPSSSRLRGVGIGLATALKVTPGLFVVYLLLTRRFRTAAVAIATFAATVAISALTQPSATKNYWTKYLLDPHRVGRLENAANQSLRGMIVRIDHTRVTHPAEVLLIAVVLVAGLAIATTAYRRAGECWGVLACAVTGLLTSPIAWSHHWVWCVPIGVLLWFRARALAWVGLAVFCSFAVWAVPHADSAELHFSPLQVAVSGWYVAFGLLFLAFVARACLLGRADSLA